MPKIKNLNHEFTLLDTNCTEGAICEMLSLFVN